MGASLIGHECARHIWLTWRWALTPTFPGRILRLFDTGKREETRLIEELKGIGATVWETDPNTGDQWRVTACNGHFGGSLDGVAKGLPEAPKSVAVLEFKTHSAKSFGDLTKHKVQISKPQHYIQMQIYMGLMEIDRALYIAVNKDTDDLYTEWVHFDQERFDAMIQRAQELIDMPQPPARLSDDPANWQCKMCQHWKLCHGGIAAEMNCRTCCSATPVANGEWRCETHNNRISTDDQRKGCEVHLLLPALIPYAEPIDGGEGWMAYRHKETGAQFVNAAEGTNEYGPIFSSRELHHCPDACLQGIAEIKNQFGGKVISGGLKDDPATAWDDIATHPYDLKAKPASATDKETRRKNKAFLNVLDQMQNK